MINKKWLNCFVLFTILFCLSIQVLAEVRIWEEPIVLPTYKVDDTDKNPRFYVSRNYQGAKGPVYPYAMRDGINNEKSDRSYQAVYLENKYLKICVLPEVGGRLFYAIDKTNGYDLFYHQHVIKPALVGMLGAWISGGIEWCVPHHHRATTFMQMDYRLLENEDGSKTIWIGELERRHRMKWSLGITLHPEKSYIEVNVKLFNRTPLAHSFLYWANVAVHVNDDYQVIFPPSTQIATYHGKHEFTRWPIGNGIFNGADYDGVDISWWKNHPHATSCFGWEPKEDFFAGYDHGKKAGVMHIANHHVVPGRKLWTFGVNSTTDRKVLTDNDGPYCEIMVGAFSDNQPDYTWSQPHEVKSFTQYWYPIRDMGGVKNANTKAAVNFEILPDNRAKISVNSTSEYKNARIEVTADKEAIFSKRIILSPQRPFSQEIATAEGMKEEDYEVTVYSSSDDVLLRYRPKTREPSPLPEPVDPPPAPQDVKTMEELYLIGLRLTQFYNPVLEPYPYFEEALKRDPLDTRVNTMLGIDDLRRGLFKNAEEKFKIAISRNTYNYTNPKNCEAYYYLGVCLKLQERFQEAYDAFYKAVWSVAWKSTGYYSLAEIDCQNGDFLKALEHLDRCISLNSLDTKALNLKSTILRRMGRYDEARECALKSGQIDPLDNWAVNELVLAEHALGRTKVAQAQALVLDDLMRGDEQLFLELSADYMNCGLLDEAIDVLSCLDNSVVKNGSIYPLVYYYLGYLWEKKGEDDRATAFYRKAYEMPEDYCFPFRLETIRVLEHACDNNPEDYRALYYLGNLLYDIQPARAILEWEKSRNIKSSFHMVHRNLGFAYYHFEKDIKKAITSLENAIALNDQDPVIYHELDVLQEKAGYSPQARLKGKSYETIMKRDDILSRSVGLYVQIGEYDKAIQVMAKHHFNTWEGGGAIHDVYVDAYLLRGLKKQKEKKIRAAIDDFIAALDYPENLEVDRPLNDIKATRAYYLIGNAFQSLGNETKAREYYKNALDIKVGESHYLYYQGLAHRAMGQKQKAKQIFDQLIEMSTKKIDAGVGVDFFAKFGEKAAADVQLSLFHYMLGLGYKGAGEPEKAKAQFEKTLELNPNYLWAQVQLSVLN